MISLQTSTLHCSQVMYQEATVRTPMEDGPCPATCFMGYMVLDNRCQGSRAVDVGNPTGELTMPHLEDINEGESHRVSIQLTKVVPTNQLAVGFGEIDKCITTTVVELILRG